MYFYLKNSYKRLQPKKVGNGSCTDINECVVDEPCHDNATCTNNDGSYSCACNNGYLGDGFNCTDINECDTNDGGCDGNATCTNTDGSFYCTCNFGYDGDGFLGTHHIKFLLKFILSKETVKKLNFDYLLIFFLFF